VWRLRAVTGHRANGQAIQASQTVTGTERQAEKALQRFVINAQDKRVAVGPETFGDFLDRWLVWLGPNRSPATMRTYGERAKRVCSERATSTRSTPGG
jgi:hypothetical protein